ncbi:MAG TPA: hypothetical protein VK922_06345 [Gemmatimonadaceae bacterium]|nr:hypothetical protein [Gemmatimonadaceae bacterium]
MAVQERPLTADELADLRDFQAAGNEGVAVVTDRDTPSAIVEAIGAVSSGLGELEQEARVQASVGLGALWGEQVHRALGWEWVMLSWGKPDDEIFALVSPDRAFYISPVYLLLPYATGARSEDTSVLLFNMLLDGSGLPRSKPHRYRELS